LKVIVLLNKSSGPGSEDKDEEECNLILKLFSESKVDAKTELTEGKDIQEIVKRSLNLYDAIVIAGGDGSISSAAEIIAGTDTVLGVIPSGTFNHFAKDLMIPLTQEEAVKVIAAGNISKVDIGEVNGKKFINNSSIGIYPEMVKERKFLEKQEGKSKWSAMLTASVNLFKRFRLKRISVSINGRTFRRLTPIVFIGNNKYEMSSFTLGNRTKLNGGKLSLYIPKCTNIFSLIKIVFFTLFGIADQEKNFDNIEAGEIEISVRKKTVNVAKDGEIMKLDSPLHYKIFPASLNVIVPAPASIAE
jgi:diacylglycerol kinase family enzyme